ncbi:MAG: tetratricopeptide repeat protein, partial [Candidatus Cloacimonetes bacterium]|nr:tetratricopeptide repeat protein [Candidatus Cloacimonadota bacterium]
FITYNNIGMVYDAWKQYEKAIEYYEQALEIDRKFQNEPRIAIRLNNIGYAHRALKQFDKALEYLQQALKIEMKYGRKDRIAIRLTNIGLIYISTEKYEQALINFRKAEEIIKKLNMPNYLSTLYNNFGHVFILQQKYTDAEKYLKKSQKIADEKDMKQQQLYNHLEFALLYQKRGDFKKAYQSQVNYTKLNEKIFSEEKLKQLSEFEAKFETAKKEKEIEILTKNQEIQDLKLKENRIVKYSFIIGFILVLLLALIIYRAYRRERIEIEKRKIAELKLSDLNKNLEKRVEEEVTIRSEQEQKAIEQSRLAALGELAAGIAHEINQPLHSIAFAIDNMSLAIEEDDADKEYLQKKTKNIFSDVDRMKRIIDHIRTFSRKQTGEEKEPFNINQSITNAVNMISEQYANHRIKLDIELDKNLPETMGNIYRFEQVVLILLSNGKDAIEERAEIMDENFQKKLSIRTFQQNNNILMEFEDNGTGISKENLDKIFNPFYTTKKPGEGTGLGLSIAFGIVGEMDGKIEVESKVGKGTKMQIRVASKQTQDG